MSRPSELYLLDTNVLVDAARDYYRMDQVPEFWDWLVHMGEEGAIKIPQEIYEELVKGTDEIPEWLKQRSVRDALRLQESHAFEQVQRVLVDGYAADLLEEELDEIGQDAHLISYALGRDSVCIVTAEKSKPSKKRGRRHVPDVCAELGVRWLPKYELTRELDFRTSWKKPRP